MRHLVATVFLFEIWFYSVAFSLQFPSFGAQNRVKGAILERKTCDPILPHASQKLANLLNAHVISIGIALATAVNPVIADPRTLVAETNPASTSSSRLSNPAWHKAEINLPSDDFWYPPFMIGDWFADFSFDEAVFADEIKTEVPLETFLRQGNVPGLEKYSVLFIPKMGEDAKGVPLRFVQIDSHPREDHPHNIRHMVESFSGGESIVDTAPYGFQKAPDWFHSPANKWKIVLHERMASSPYNQKGVITVDLLTQKRDIATFAGSVETFEGFRQTLHLPDKAAPLTTDYALNWQFSIPAALRDEFITVDNLRKADELVGRLNVFVYLQPSNDLYKKIGGQPAGVYKYVVEMHRKNTQADRGVRATTFPFVWRDAGPLELDKYFGAH
jgi:hypothetical protein